MRIEKLRKNYNIELEWVHFPLHPETPAEGIPLEKLFSGSNANERAERQKRMKGLMDAEGLPYGERTHTYNSRLAQELGKWAESQPGGAMPLHDALFKAYFVNGRNIGELDTLVEIATSVGLPADDARKVLEARAMSKAIDADWSNSRRMGVTGVPTFAAGGYGVVGAQPYEVLEQLMQEVGAERRTSEA